MKLSCCSVLFTTLLLEETILSFYLLQYSIFWCANNESTYLVHRHICFALITHGCDNLFRIDWLLISHSMKERMHHKTITPHVSVHLLRELSRIFLNFSFNHIHNQPICCNRLHLICLHSIFSSFPAVSSTRQEWCSRREKKRAQLKSKRKVFYVFSIDATTMRAYVFSVFFHSTHSLTFFIRVRFSLVRSSHSPSSLCLPFLQHIHVVISLSIRFVFVTRLLHFTVFDSDF